MKKKNKAPVDPVKRRKAVHRWFVDWACYLAGAALYAFSVAIITAPNHMAPGGVSGLSTMLNFLFVDKLPFMTIGVLTVVFNIPIIILGWIRLGRKFVRRTAIVMVIQSALVDVFQEFVPPYTNENMLIVSLAGGVLAGAGLGLIFMRGASTGGTDIVAQVLEKHISHIPIGRIVMAMDFVVVGASAFVYKSVDNALYAAVMIAVDGFVIDLIISGNDKGKMMLVSSSKSEEIAKAVIERMDRGATLLHTTGAYSGEERKMVMVAVRRSEITRLQRIVTHVDPAAFIIAMTTDEILGEGFKHATP